MEKAPNELGSDLHSDGTPAQEAASSRIQVAQSIAILGTGSDVGKSILTAGIGRLLHRAGLRVAPFKAQNMSNNAAPAWDATTPTCWGEIGTAQALQARACGWSVPLVQMNPVLLKSGGRAADGQYLCSVLLNGHHIATEDYGSIAHRTAMLRKAVRRAHSHLAEQVDCVVIEGAGSCTELNLMERDIVNLPLVRELNCPWLLVADIDKGGVFAQIIGTQACVTVQDWDLCCGVVVNRLRGEAKYFEPGPRILEERVGKPIFVVPWLYNLHLPEEDGMGLVGKLDKVEEYQPRQGPSIVVVAYPHIAIDSDILPLEQDPEVQVIWCRRRIPTTFPDVVILPGSRLTRSDLEWMHEVGWTSWVREHVRQGGRVLGICGGYQMLGHSVEDRMGVEGEAGSSEGLAILPVSTVLRSTDEKIVAPRRARLAASDVVVAGFEIRCGRTYPDESSSPMLETSDANQDSGSRIGNVMGCYLHGALDSIDARREILGLSGCRQESDGEDPLDRLAQHLESCGLSADKICDLMSSHYDV